MKTRKVALDLEALAVESFATTVEAEEERGTVRGREADAAAAPRDCTCRHSCVCETAYYNCGTGPFTIYSCDYTANRSCVYGAE